MTLQGHTSDVTCVIELADGRLCSASKDDTIKVRGWVPLETHMLPSHKYPLTITLLYVPSYMYPLTCTLSQLPSHNYPLTITLSHVTLIHVTLSHVPSHNYPLTITLSQLLSHNYPLICTLIHVTLISTAINPSPSHFLTHSSMHPSHSPSLDSALRLLSPNHPPTLSVVTSV